MASIFKKRVLKEKLESFEIPNFQSKLDIVTQWYEAYKNGSLKKKTESEVEQEFIQNIFCEVLDYTRYPSEPHTIIPQGKTQTSGQKPDAILGHFKSDKDITKVAAVCEIKDANTPLDKSQRREGSLSPVQQAFKYKTQYKNCDFVIATNFFEIRLLKDNELNYEKWTLEDLVNPANNHYEFRKFYYLLCEKHLVVARGKSKTLQILSDIQVEQEKITKDFYKLYKELRQELIKNIIKNNPEAKKRENFYHLTVEKAQKIIDRLVFVAFCEDLGLLPENILLKVIESDNNTFGSTWDTLKGFFNAVDTGSLKLNNAQGYNGELFKPDKDLDGLIIDDEICREFLQIGQYDFSEDLSVNILGHIFEQSISDLEELKSVGEGVDPDKGKSKRKKDGVFYTPEYIVDKIVEKSVGVWLKQRELEILDKYSVKEDLKDSNYNKRLLSAYVEYQSVLQNIKVLDPACGSGAFLVRVFDFLLAENQRVADMIASLQDGAMSLFDTEQVFKDILQNNIYGVDLNPESVEITKLSLWLKTAQKGKKLASLYNNIKCGNSLIPSAEIAGDKAFDWDEEFQKVMDKGGFDVIVGNPPYLRVQGLKEFHTEAATYYEKNYQSATGNYDIYVLFCEKAHQILSPKGICGYILPHKWLISEFGVGIREYFSNHKAVSSIYHFGHELVFEQATTYTCLLFISKKPTDYLNYFEVDPAEITSAKPTLVSYKNLNSEKWNLNSREVLNLLEKIQAQPLTVEKIFEKVFVGLQTSADKIYFIEDAKLSSGLVTGYSKQLDKEVTIEVGLLKPILKGQDVSQYLKPSTNRYVIFPYILEDGKASPMSEKYVADKFPNGYKYLKDNEQDLRRRERGRMDTKDWFLYIYPKSLTEFDQEKIITPEISLGTNMTLDKHGEFYHNTKCYSFVKNQESKNSYESLLSILNSPLMWFYLSNTGYVLRGGYFTFKTKYLNPFPLPKISSELDKELTGLVSEIIHLTTNLNQQKENFIRLLEIEFSLDKWPRNLSVFWQITYEEFILKLPIKLGLQQKGDLLDLWNKYAPELASKENQIDLLKNKINEIVFDLYDLTPEERKIVLESTSN